MVDNKIDYYEVLGITEEEKKLKGDAFSDVVRKKYKKLAVKYHPDKWVNGTDQEKKDAEEKFKQINEANMVLSDPQKRERYDMGDMSGFDFPDFSGFNPFGEMGDNFDPFSGFGSFFGGHKQKYENTFERGNDIRVDVYVTLEDILNGKKKDITYSKKKACSHCNGTGSSDGKLHTCKHCNGTGRIKQTTRRGNMIMQNITTCPYCNGTGKSSDSVSACKYCNGTGFEEVEEKIQIDVPAGIFDEAAIRISGKGCEPSNSNGQNGDLIVVFHETKHNKFKRDGNNLYMDLLLDIDEALCGEKKDITTLDGSVVTIKIPELCEYGKVLRLRGKGIKDVRIGDEVGDLYITIKYRPITSITEKQKSLIKEFYGRK